jgi:Ser/Thr protein kinase RdoA (MazF antagonist)
MLWWADDHPVVTDPALAPFREAAEGLVSRPGRVTLLRHLAGRRATSMVTTADGEQTVLKVFASPRARGNHRRLSALADALGPLVPTSHGIDPTGHASLLGWQPGVALDELDDAAFVAAAEPAGAALGALHRCGAELDRSWHLDREVEQLVRRATARTADDIERLLGSGRFHHLGTESSVPSHRDMHPRQIVVDGAEVAFIDLDDATSAPAGLDVGNFVAHLRREGALGRRDLVVVDAAVDAFLGGYGDLPPTWADWCELSLWRLVGLAESRHGRSDWAVAIASLIAPARARPRSVRAGVRS